MSLRLHNTLTKREEDFIPLRPPEVTMYTCGPTVYGRPHIGNYSSFLMADLLRRWLEVSGYVVRQVKNITDVGHLVADRDEGEDKVEKQARKEFGEVSMRSVIGVARKYEEQYLEDERTLNMLPLAPECRPRATDYIPQMREMVGALLRKGRAYAIGDGIYFAVESFPDYGKLSGNTLETLRAGARVEVKEEKRHPADFALWKFCVGGNARHVLRWESPRGPRGETYPEGFPGWHIECSAMSRALLGDRIDIHTGGEDNIFPHHECEIAQSESSGHAPFVRFWLHKRRIEIAPDEAAESAKMSKSLGNVLTVPDVLAQRYDPLDLRYFLLSAHYRTHLKFSWKGMEDAKKARRTIMEWMDRGGRGEYAPIGAAPPEPDVSRIRQCDRAFSDAMDADLSTPAALAAIFGCIHYMNSCVLSAAPAREELARFVEKIRHTFGCFENRGGEGSVPEDVRSLLSERDRARKAKDFARSDRLRDDIRALRYEVRDTPEGQEVRKL